MVLDRCFCRSVRAAGGCGPAPLSAANAQTFGEDVATLAFKDKLVWLPAHKSSSAIGEAKLSNGVRLSSVDWRANRLVDMLARVAAGHVGCEREVLGLLESAETVPRCLHHAVLMLLLMLHHQVVTIGDGGKTITQVVRDFVDKPRLTHTTSVLALVLPSASTCAKEVGTIGVKNWPCVVAWVRSVPLWWRAMASHQPRTAWPGLAGREG